MMHAQSPPKMPWSMIVNMILHRWVAPWSGPLIVLILLLILWRVW